MVRVNGKTVTRLPVLVDPQVDTIELDGEPVELSAKVYLALHKPRGVVCSHYDPSGRTRAVDLVADRHGRVFPVGRLDVESSGLLLLTNDGDFANRLAHPRYGVPKTYTAEVAGSVHGRQIDQLVQGIRLAEGRARAQRVRVVRRGHSQSLLEITLREGRNRQVRRMLARLGHPVRRLMRVRVGSVELGKLKPGRVRRLRSQEVHKLLELSARQRPATRRSNPP